MQLSYNRILLFHFLVWMVSYTTLREDVIRVIFARVDFALCFILTTIGRLKIAEDLRMKLWSWSRVRPRWGWKFAMAYIKIRTRSDLRYLILRTEYFCSLGDVIIHSILLLQLSTSLVIKWWGVRSTKCVWEIINIVSCGGPAWKHWWLYLLESGK